MRRRGGSVLLPWAVLLISAAPASGAETAVAYFTLAVGYNGTSDAAGAQGLEPLKYADDDAAAMHRLALELGHSSLLLAGLDADTRRRMPELVGQARPPTLADLARAIDELNVAVAAAARSGRATTLLLFFSGHGLVGGGEAPGLALGDGRLTHTRLYEQILPQLKADTVHLIVDACHAEAVVRPRDVQAVSVSTRAEDLRGYLEQRTLARFPQVGAVVASTSTDQTHEWDALRSGVFTHEVLSALRGGADIDGDRKIEYSELAAFLSAANRNVIDPRARPTALLRAPVRRPRAALAELSRPQQAGRLGGRPAALGAAYVEDARGNRLCSFHAEPGHQVELVLPAGISLFVRGKRGEAETLLSPSATRRFEDLVWGQAQARARGAIATSLRQGLFASRFGPAYYSGFVDRNEDLAPVAVPFLDTAAELDESGEEPRPARGADLAWGATVPLAAVAVGFAALSFDARGDVQSARFERDSSQARARLYTFGALSIGAATAAIVTGTIGYLMGRR